MKIRVPGPFLAFLLLWAPVSGLGSVLVKRFAYIHDYYTWQDAQTFCRSSPDYADLVVLYEQPDADALDLQHYYAWIDGNLTPNFHWHWHGDDFYPWAGNKPSSGDGCAYVSSDDKRFYAAGCAEYYFFICFITEEGGYTFVNRSKTWSDAQQHCSNMNGGLAAITDHNELDSAASERDFPVWTGLYRDGGSWRWSAGVSDYRNWAPNEPSSDGDCVAVSSVSKAMSTHSCSDRFPFVCFKDNLLLVKENRTWEEALDHCSALRSPSGASYQLVSVQPDDYAHMMHRAMEADGDEVWTGLRYLAGGWFWVNGADVALSDLPRCPVAGQHCGAFSRNDPGGLEARDCLEERNFLCYSQW